MRNIRHSSDRSAFTLVELLAVSAVVGVVASLLLPAVSTAKARASARHCSNNVREMGMALTLYQNDWNQFPFQGIDDESYYFGTGSNYWFHALHNYTDSAWGRGIMRCPAYKGLWDEGHQPNMVAFGSYSYNSYGSRPENGSGPGEKPRGLGGVAGGFLRHPPVREADIREPSQMYALGDARLLNVGLPGSEYGFGISAYMWWDYENPPSQHARGLNIAFVDGHVALVATNILFNSEAEFARRWNSDYQGD
jgi:prepilin-type N-terminal cleavage/methylation domain-containing protein/prepilin-type processing-associated H-X9-DG protein